MSNHIERKRKKRIQRIVDAGAQVFARKGYHATRMQDIADELDLQKGSLYYYFDSKEALLFHIIEEELGRALVNIEAVVMLDEPPLAKIEQGVAAHFATFHGFSNVSTIFLFEKVESINVKAGQKINAMSRRYEEYWRQLLQEGVEAGALSANLDIKIATKAIMGMCNMSFIWFQPTGRMSIEEIATHFTQYILRGMAAPQ